MDHVYVTAGLPDDIIATLGEIATVGKWEGEGPVPRQVLLGESRSCDGLLTMLTDPIDRELLDSAPRLRVVSQAAVGVDNIDVEACLSRGVKVGHTPDVLTDTVADTAFALMAAVIRRLPEGAEAVRKGLWGPWDPWWMLGGDLHGSTLGIVGMGRIGRAVARRSAGFSMDLVYSSPSSKDVEGAVWLDLEQLLKTADIVLLAAPLSPATHHLIGARELELMGTDSYLVNIARGGLVDTDALVEALSTGSIAGAALDVTDPEPLPPDHPLLGYANCLVVPHIGSASVKTRRAMFRLAVANLRAGLTGSPMSAQLVSVP